MQSAERLFFGPKQAVGSDAVGTLHSREKNHKLSFEASRPRTATYGYMQKPRVSKAFDKSIVGAASGRQDVGTSLSASPG
jgi:hypothetical protein